jgi:hypothetical protein
MPVSYQWYRLAKGVGDGLIMTGQTSSSLSLSGLNISSNDSDSYRCVVTLIGTGYSFAGPASSVYFCSSPYVYNPDFLGAARARGLFACGINSQNALGDGTQTTRTWLNSIAGDKFNGQLGNFIRKISAGARHGFVIGTNLHLWGWGSQSSYVGTGQWGGTVASPVRIGTSTWRDVAAGGDHSIGIGSDNRLYGWGLADEGDGRAPYGNEPVLIDAGAWVSVAAGGGVGEGHSLAIKGSESTGTLWTWGRNNEGQLGLGDNANRSLPVKVNDFIWSKMAAGQKHTLAIRSDGTLWGWGYNSMGQVGDGTTANKNSPVLIDGGSWNEVSAGLAHSLAIRSDGTLWAWGVRVGDGTMNNSLVPKKISNESWRAIGAGWLHSAAIKSDNTLWTWGQNSGALSNGLLTTDGSLFGGTESLYPTMVDAGYWGDVSCAPGGDHFLAFR